MNGLDSTSSILEGLSFKPTRHSKAVNSVSLLLTLGAFGYFNDAIAPRLSGNEWLNLAAGIGLSMGLYVGLYNALVWLFGTFLEDRINPREAIAGEWIYKLTILGRSRTERFGICTIERVGNEIAISGIHFDPIKRKFTSKFVSDHVHLRGSELTILYKSSGVDEEVYIREGAYLLTTQGCPPERISGVWADMPAKNSGEIIMQRRTPQSEAILSSYGYPANDVEVSRLLLESALDGSSAPPGEIDIEAIHPDPVKPDPLT